MNTPVTPFTAVYVRWLDCVGAMLLANAPAAPSRHRAANDPQMLPHLDWDDEEEKNRGQSPIS